MTHLDLMDRIAQLNPAPSIALTAREKTVRDEQLTRLIFQEPPQQRAQRPREWNRYLVAGAGVAFVALVGVVALGATVGIAPTAVTALGPGELSQQAVSSWTAVGGPLGLGHPVADNCAATVDAEPSNSGKQLTIVNSDLRGKVASVIVAQGGYTGWCVGTDGAPMFMLLEFPDGATFPAADGTIRLGPSGGRLSPAGYGFAAGTVGKGVTGVTVHEDGVDTVATVENGWWTAWWPSDDDELLVTGTITVEVDGGRTTTYDAKDLQVQTPED
jgi:hypothetical protein